MDLAIPRMVLYMLYLYNCVCVELLHSGINVQLIYDQIRTVESIDDSRLKVTLSINRPNVRAKVIC